MQSWRFWTGSLNKQFTFSHVFDSFHPIYVCFLCASTPLCVCVWLTVCVCDWLCVCVFLCLFLVCKRSIVCVCVCVCWLWLCVILWLTVYWLCLCVCVDCDCVPLCKRSITTYWHLIMHGHNLHTSVVGSIIALWTLFNALLYIFLPQVWCLCSEWCICRIQGWMEVFMMANLICYGCSDGVLLVFELKPWIAHQPGLCLYVWWAHVLCQYLPT